MHGCVHYAGDTCPTAFERPADLPSRCCCTIALTDRIPPKKPYLSTSKASTPFLRAARAAAAPAGPPPAMTIIFHLLSLIRFLKFSGFLSFFLFFRKNP